MAVINGTASDDTLNGTAGMDLIYGHGGNDKIDGGLGADTMYGGAGDDIYIADVDNEGTHELAGEGTDTVMTTASKHTLADNVERLINAGYAGGTFWGTGNALDNYLQGWSGQDVLDGGLGADVMVGGAGTDIYKVDNAGDTVVEEADQGNDIVHTTLTSYTLSANVEQVSYVAGGTAAFTGTGNALKNVIFGGAGNDVLDGGGEADLLGGNDGNDTYYTDNLDRVQEYADQGLDTAMTTANTVYLWQNVENLFYIGAPGVRFEGNGNDLDNRIEGGSGNDVLNGRDGNDLLAGHNGNDTYYVHQTGDTIVEAADEGVDTVFTWTSSYTLSANVERMLAAAGTDFTGTGNALANELHGHMGNDTLIGMAGTDTMYGYGGDDTYDVDNAGDVVEESVGAGTDRVNTSLVQYTLAANVEQLFYNGAAGIGTRLTGNGLGNLIQGGSGNDELNGGTGGDTMIGLGGDDDYWVDSLSDQIVEAANGGYDLVYTTLLAFQLGDHVEGLVYDGPSELGFAGTGNALDNYLAGGGGNDMLDGKGGADRMYGYDGDDIYIVDHEDDDLYEDAGDGDDAVYTSLATYTVGENIEYLFRMQEDTGDFHGIGNWQVNQISGAKGNDLLDGGEGDDLLFGNQGNDTFRVDSVGDTAVEKAGEGTDTVEVSGLIGWMLGANLERLTYSGTANFEAIGNALDNHLSTGSGDDLLNGGAGADTMAGKAGNDVYVVDHQGDTIVEQAGEGLDWVNTTLNAFTLAANVENLLYSGAYGAAFAATGNAGNNIIHAGEGDDTIDGGAGADQMNGRSGNDIYVVDHFGDTVVEFTIGGTDEVRTALGSRSDFTKMYILPENVENLTGLSAGAQGVYGNALDNVIKMGGGGDLVVLHDGGNDNVQSGGGNDFLFYGNKLTADDSNDGGAGFDTLGLLGGYSLTFAATSLVGIEKLAVYSSGLQWSGYNYNLTTVDANVAAGQKLMVVGQSLGAGETLTFNGFAETDGSFNVRGGKGNDGIATGAGDDQLWGNLGADKLFGGAGEDQFEYLSAAESTNAGRDEILDFGFGDKINLKAIDADGNAANGNSKFAFIGEAAFSHAAGQLRAVELDGKWLVEGDIDGNGFADISILVTTTGNHDLAMTDFWL